MDQSHLHHDEARPEQREVGQACRQGALVLVGPEGLNHHEHQHQQHRDEGATQQPDHEVRDAVRLHGGEVEGPVVGDRVGLGGDGVVVGLQRDLAGEQLPVGARRAHPRGVEGVAAGELPQDPLHLIRREGALAQQKQRGHRLLALGLALGHGQDPAPRLLFGQPPLSQHVHRVGHAARDVGGPAHDHQGAGVGEAVVVLAEGVGGVQVVLGEREPPRAHGGPGVHEAQQDDVVAPVGAAHEVAPLGHDQLHVGSIVDVARLRAHLLDVVHDEGVHLHRGDLRAPREQGQPDLGPTAGADDHDPGLVVEPEGDEAEGLAAVAQALHLPVPAHHVGPGVRVDEDAGVDGLPEAAHRGDAGVGVPLIVDDLALRLLGQHLVKRLGGRPVDADEPAHAVGHRQGGHRHEQGHAHDPGHAPHAIPQRSQQQQPRRQGQHADGEHRGLRAQRPQQQRHQQGPHRGPQQVGEVEPVGVVAKKLKGQRQRHPAEQKRDQRPHEVQLQVVRRRGPR